MGGLPPDTKRQRVATPPTGISQPPSSLNAECPQAIVALLKIDLYEQEGLATVRFWNVRYLKLICW